MTGTYKVNGLIGRLGWLTNEQDLSQYGFDFGFVYMGEGSGCPNRIGKQPESQVIGLSGIVGDVGMVPEKYGLEFGDRDALCPGFQVVELAPEVFFLQGIIEFAGFSWVLGAQGLVFSPVKLNVVPSVSLP